MQPLYHLGFIAIIIAAAVKYFTSQALGIQFQNFNYMEDWEKVLYGVSALWFALAFWNALGRRRCPDCNSVKHKRLHSQEIDRWPKEKMRRTKISENEYSNIPVTVTMIKIRNTYNCNICDRIWNEDKTLEKTR